MEEIQSLIDDTPRYYDETSGGFPDLPDDPSTKQLASALQMTRGEVGDILAALEDRISAAEQKANHIKDDLMRHRHKIGDQAWGPPPEFS